MEDRWDVLGLSISLHIPNPKLPATQKTGEMSIVAEKRRGVLSPPNLGLGGTHKIVIIKEHNKFKPIKSHPHEHHEFVFGFLFLCAMIPPWYYTST